MSIFKKAVLTKAGKSLIAKNQTNRGPTEFTRAVSGAGAWNLTEDLEAAETLRAPKQEFDFSGIDIPDGNPATVIVTVLLNNKDLKELYYVTELGIYAKDPDAGEVLYALIVTDEQRIYMPAENGIGISSIVERINIEVSNSANVILRTDAGLVSATDFLDLKKLVSRINEAFKGGQPGQLPFKKSGESYDVLWKDLKKDVVIEKREEFSETGEENTIYLDPEDAALYIWKDDEYFKLPLGADAVETLQKQISKNKDSIKSLEERVAKVESRFKETEILVLADAWETTEEDGITVFVQEIKTEVKADQKGTVWATTTGATAKEIEAEQNEQAIFFRFGKAFTEDGKVVLKCYKKRPTGQFGLLIEGGA